MGTNPDEPVLLARLRQRIRDAGPITFADFMEAALYDPRDGFYARAQIGGDGHFVTSPHVSPAFGNLVARQLAESWDFLGKPSPFTVVELGAGDGTLARRILESVGPVPELGSALRYLVVERTEGQSEALRGSGLETIGSLAEAGPMTGCILANELLDNVPFHRLRERAGNIVEVVVGHEGGRLVELEAEPSEQALSGLTRPLSPGEERPVSPQAMEIVRGMAGILERGYAFLFDYGFVTGETPGPVHSYRDHRVVADVLDDPGGRDVTAAVDLEAIAAEAATAGLQVWGPVTQRDALIALGYRLWSAGVRNRQADTREAREAIRLYEARSRASILIDEGKLGGLYLIALGTKGLPPPVSVRGDKDSGC
ncbi:MAG: SAM-dependent methyltransferase [Actinomycetota bacterium]